MTFQIFPAIDLRGEAVVRLRRGEFEQETVFSRDPTEVARAFVGAGAEWLHLVDLDGAVAGAPVQTRIIQAVIAATAGRASCQVAGGLRTTDSVASVFASGAARVVVGTAALRAPSFAGMLARSHGAARIVVALDVRDGLALGEGWRAGAPGVRAEEVLQALADAGVTTFAATAIDRDGMLQGPDLRLLGRLVALDRGSVIASGGISSIADIRAVRALGCGGAIVGRALYEGSIDLGEALRAASERN